MPELPVSPLKPIVVTTFVTVFGGIGMICTINGLSQAVAAPLSKTEKIVIVDSGNGQGKGAAKVSGYVTDILASLPETVNALTGINLMDVLKLDDKHEKNEVKIEEAI